MEKLGGLITFIAYLFLLSVMVGYIVKKRDLNTVSITEAQVMAEQEGQNGTEPDLEPVVEGTEDKETAAISPEDESTLLVIDSQPIEQEEAQRDIEECLVESAPANENLLLEQTGAHEGTITTAPETEENIIPHSVEEILNNSEFQSEQYEATAESTTHRPALQLNNPEEIPIEFDKIGSNQSSRDTDEATSNTADTIDEVNLDNEKQVINLIDSAFACREDNSQEAARYFEEAWEITADYNLKYLLTMELIAIYKDNGWYTRALSLLESFLSLPGDKSAIINEINRQIKYISLLIAELNRLGISGLPESKIPRLVRFNIDAEMTNPGK